jgi:hypothetical protein
MNRGDALSLSYKLSVSAAGEFPFKEEVTNLDHRQNNLTRSTQFLKPERKKNLLE